MLKAMGRLNMNIQKLFQQAAVEKRKLFIPYLTCGDPSLADTLQLVKQLAAEGADVIELGVPFSDPVADGPTNQASAMRALQQGVSLYDCCQLVKQLREQHCFIPIVLFTYFNPLLRFGLERFAALAQASGINAVLVVDLPVEEADELADLLIQYQIGRIALISPTTTMARIQASQAFASEFLYYVSRTGVTGEQVALSSTLSTELAKVRRITTLPIVVGFGISTPTQAQAAAMLADGVVVGSALVKQLENSNRQEALQHVIDLAKRLHGAINRVT